MSCHTNTVRRTLPSAPTGGERRGPAEGREWLAGIEEPGVTPICCCNL